MNSDDHMQEFINFGITNVPTTLIMNGDEILFRKVGGMSEQEILQLFNENGLTSRED